MRAEILESGLCIGSEGVIHSLGSHLSSPALTLFQILGLAPDLTLISMIFHETLFNLS